jgi:hypothetical protein
MTPPEGELPGLDAKTLDRLSESWDDGGLWKDIRFLADRFWSGPDTDRVMAWHHLVFAVGNFKRQGGTRLKPAPLGWAPPAARTDSVEVPGIGLVGVNDTNGWEKLLGMRGLGVATGTTLLSALWPEQHFVFDKLVHAVANGLRLHAGLEPTSGVTAESTKLATQTLENYKTVRGWVLAVASDTRRSLTVVERALYEVGRKVKGETGRSWGNCAGALADCLADE